MVQGLDESSRGVTTLEDTFLNVKRRFKSMIRSGLLRTLKVGSSRLGLELRPVNKHAYRSETSRCRGRLQAYCAGSGVDIGFGGDPITDHAIRVDLPHPYAFTGDASVQLSGDARCLEWFNSGVLDFVYSSHLLEDFADTTEVLTEWLRVLKTGGHLIIFCPDEQAYRQHCIRTNQTYNTHHVHANFSIRFVKEILQNIGTVQVVHECPLVDDYSWELVCRKLH
jgi:predicted SAM-dependent methyltransferase